MTWITMLASRHAILTALSDWVATQLSSRSVKRCRLGEAAESHRRQEGGMMCAGILSARKHLVAICKRRTPPCR